MQFNMGFLVHCLGTKGKLRGGEHMLKVKDWPPDAHFSEKLTRHNQVQPHKHTFFHQRLGRHRHAAFVVHNTRAPEPHCFLILSIAEISPVYWMARGDDAQRPLYNSTQHAEFSGCVDGAATFSQFVFFHFFSALTASAECFAFGLDSWLTKTVQGLAVCVSICYCWIPLLGKGI